MNRPRRLVAVLGTGTDVGKTWVSAATLRGLRGDGLRVAARKPAQSFDAGTAQPTDAEVLADASGEEAGDVCPAHRWYAVAMAPPMAAAELGRPPFTVSDLVAETRWPGGVDIGLVETAGGVLSPIATDGHSLSLVEALDPDLIVLVADAGLGTINAVRLAARAVGRAPLIVVLNRFDESDRLHARNREWLEADGLDLATGPAGLLRRL